MPSASSTCAAFALWGEALFARLAQPVWFALIFFWLFGVVLASALAVVRHADHVAEILGEPYGTLVLTLAVTAIEVMSISAVMLHGANNPTLVRDTLFSIVMILLGGVVGAALLLGGWRHREQHYNLQGANAYLGVIIPLAVLTLTLANFTTTTPGPTLSTAQQMFLLVSLRALPRLPRRADRPPPRLLHQRRRRRDRRRCRAPPPRCTGTRSCSSPTSCPSSFSPNNSRIRSTI